MHSLKEKPNVVALRSETAPDAAAMLDALPDPLLVLDPEGNVISSNHAAQEFFNTGRRMLRGMGLSQLLGEANPARQALGHLRERVTIHDVIINGKPVSSLSAVPMESSCLIVLRYDPLPVQSDWVAKIKRTLKPAQHLARMLAHEIKNPLSGIRGAAQLLAKSGLKPDDRILAELIDRETQRIFRLIEKVNVFGDAPHDQYAAVNLHEALAQVIELAKSGFPAKIVTQYDPSLPPIHGHYDGLVQAFVNLVKNAVEALGEAEGQIVLRSYYDTAAAFHPESHARLPICIEVEDNGAGIDAAMQRRLFEPYQTTKRGGEGLGLSIVSKIIDDHGGVINVDSRPGRTVFRVSFPRGDKS
jgi:two-component system, NtrC family, nitrogen regulation sensor histidine kinase GlnL